jgi:hypothetical protein
MFDALLMDKDQSRRPHFGYVDETFKGTRDHSPPGVSEERTLHIQGGLEKGVCCEEVVKGIF